MKPYISLKWLSLGILSSILVTLSAITQVLAVPPPPPPTVYVANTTDNPVPTLEQNLDLNGNIKVHEQETVQVEEKRVPFEVYKSTVIASGTGSASIKIDVPDGQMLIVQTVSIGASVPSGQHVLAAAFATLDDGEDMNSAYDYIPLSFQGTFMSRDNYAGTIALTMYAIHTDSHDETLEATFSRDSSIDSAYVNFSVTGYLVDLPPT